MSDTPIPSLPSLAAIDDVNVRMALQSIYDAWKVRNGDVGDGTNKFLTSDDLRAAFASVNVSGGTTNAFASIDPNKAATMDSWVRSMLLTVDNYIQQSRIWKDLGQNLDKIFEDISTNTYAISSEQAARLDAESSMTQYVGQQVSVINQNLGGLQTSLDTLATTTGANASAITSLQTTVNGVSTVAQEGLTLAQTTSDSVSGAWTVKFDANGYVVGAGLGLEGKNGTYTSTFGVVADRFFIAQPGVVSPTPMLEVATLNGVNVLAFKGVIAGASGYFSGDLNASGGTFRGELNAATGTFGGRLMAGVLDLRSITGTTEYRSSPGTYYFTLPADQNMIRYQLMAGGGGGGAGKGGEWNATAGGGGGGGAGQYLGGTLTLWGGAQILVVVGGGGGGAGSWAAGGGSGGPSYLQYWTGSTWVTAVYANPGGGGAGAPLIYGNNLDNQIAGGGGGGGYPGGEAAPGGYNGDGGTARGGYGANSVWGTGGSPGWPNNGWGYGASGYGSGGGGGAGYHGWRFSGADWHHEWFGGGGPGAGGKAIIEFYNPNTVVLRDEFINLATRVTAVEQRLGM